MEILTVGGVAAEVAKNAKSGKWLSCSFRVQAPGHADGVVVGVKAFGRWVQRIECCDICDGLPEQKTIKALKSATADLINRILASI